ncbi:aminotransferase class IV [Marinilongibacter aquaticus]|uniref:aminotransferase class IV n=1 Tax=Marinilongibacter aquaticus TaxID=2975157 RepID=UPI0021BDD714|nr:aminotransferase class IV [Marinilongibacter aquaticus]UBM57660.1 aminotransferase class IV [Marinilongibacter aquaticus]
MYHCYKNGQIKPFNEVQIGVNELGLLRGYGLFDYFRTYNQSPFQWDWYWNRFANSAQKLGISVPISKEKAQEIVSELIGLSPEKECAIRFVLTGGISLDGLSSEEPTFFILSEKISDPSEKEYTQGIKVESREYLRDMPEIKSTDYKFLLKIRPELIKNESKDVLFVKDGYISELSRSNIFLINNNSLITPSENILHGITRKTVLELAKDDFNIEERPVTFQELLQAEEVFTTSSTKKVLGIFQIDNQTIGQGKVGPKTHSILAKFNALTQSWAG